MPPFTFLTGLGTEWFLRVPWKIRFVDIFFFQRLGLDYWIGYVRDIDSGVLHSGHPESEVDMGEMYHPAWWTHKEGLTFTPVSRLKSASTHSYWSHAHLLLRNAGRNIMVNVSSWAVVQALTTQGLDLCSLWVIDLQCLYFVSKPQIFFSQLWPPWSRRQAWWLLSLDTLLRPWIRYVVYISWVLW